MNNQLGVQQINPVPPSLTAFHNSASLADAKDSQHLRYTPGNGFHVRSGFKMTEVLADLKVSGAVQARNHERQAAVNQFRTMINTAFPGIAHELLQNVTNATEITVGDANTIVSNGMLRSLFA